MKSLFIILLVVAVVYFGFYQTGSIVSVPDTDSFGNYKDATSTFTTSLNGVSLTGETAYLGEISATSTAKICGQTNEAFVSNSYKESSNSLDLLSTANGGRGGCENYIFVEGTFPKGTIEVICNLQASTSENPETASYCSVNSQTKSLSVRDKSENSVVETITLKTDNTKVKIEARPKPGNGGFAQSNVQIKFVADPSSTSNTQETTTSTNTETSTTTDTTTETQEPVTSSSTESQGIFAKLNSAIQSIIDWITGLFK